MKISRIKISNFRHFDDIDIDLTYPKGHPKEGLPLDKICIIGQNGTGKTTILNLIEDFFLKMNLEDSTFNKLSISLNFNSLPTGSSIEIEYFTPNNEKKILLSRKGNEFKNDHFYYELDGKKTTFPKMDKSLTFNPSLLLYIPFGVNSRFFLESSKRKNESELLQFWTDTITKFFFGNRLVLEAFEKSTFIESEKYKKLNADYKLHLVNRIMNGEELNLVEELQKWE